MTKPSSSPSPNELAQIRLARDQAELLRDQLLAALQRLHDDPFFSPQIALSDSPRLLGLQKMQKAIHAANLAIDSIDQGLRQLERVAEDPHSSTPPTP